MTRRISLSALLLLAVSSLPAQDSPLVTASRVHVVQRRQLPELHTVRWYNSAPRTLSGLRGQVVLLDFWATWCRSCVAAHEKIQQLATRYGSAGLAVVLVHSRYTRAPGPASHEVNVPAEDVLPSFLASHHISLPVAVLEDRQFKEITGPGIPHYVLLDRTGIVRYDEPGLLPSEGEIRRALLETAPHNAP